MNRKNKKQTRQKIFIIFITILFSYLCEQETLSQTPERDQKEFSQKLEELKRRHEAFYLHQETKKNNLLQLLSFADEERQKRYREENQQELFRKEFKLKQQKRTLQDQDQDQLEAEFLAIQKKQEQERESSREAYVKRRKKLERIQKSGQSIPENEDVGLVDPTEDLR